MENPELVISASVYVCMIVSLVIDIQNTLILISTNDANRIIFPKPVCASVKYTMHHNLMYKVH